jgi:hypothetical protein
MKTSVLPFSASLDHFASIHYLPTANPSATPPETITKKLDRLAFNRDGILSLEEQRQVMVDAACAGIRTVLDSIDSAIAELRTTAGSIESEVREAVLIGGASVKGAALHAIFNRGRVSYDSKGLDALAVVVPEVLNFRKEGEPSVAIREVKH